jgi:hypothetical protein
MQLGTSVRRKDPAGRVLYHNAILFGILTTNSAFQASQEMDTNWRCTRARRRGWTDDSKLLEFSGLPRSTFKPNLRQKQSFQSEGPDRVCRLMV